MKTTLTKKLLKFILPLLVIPNLLLLAFYYSYLTHLVENETIELSKNILIQKNSVMGRTSHLQTKLQNYVQREKSLNLPTITIIDKEMKVLASAKKEHIGKPYSLNSEQQLQHYIQEVLAGKNIRLSHYEQNKCMVKPLLNSHGEIVAFSICDYKYFLDKRLAVINQTFIYIFLIIVFITFISIILTILFSFNIIQPIKLLTEGTKRVSAGDLTHTIKVSSNDEVGELVQSFNSMTQKRRDVESNLEKQNEMLNKSQITARLGSWKWDMLTNEIIWTDEVFRLFGEEVQSFTPTYEKFMSYLDDDDKISLEQAITFSIENHKPYIFEHKIRHTDGRRYYFQESGSTYYDDNGNAVLLIGTILDITETKNAQLRLKKLKERLELALLGNNDGIWDWDMLTNEVYFSPRWKEILGYADDELASEFSIWENRVHPDDFEKTYAGLQENIDGKTEYYEGVHRLKHKNGSWVWVLDRGKAIYDDNKKAIRMIGTHTDITTEKAKQLKYTQQAQMIEQTHDSVISTDLEGTILTWNLGAERLLGYSASEVIGKHVSMLHPKEDLPEVINSIETVMQTGEYIADVAHITKSGKLIDVSLSLSILKNEEGEITNLVGYAQDITKRKKAENEKEAMQVNLLRAQKMEAIGMMAGGVAHDLNNILSGIVGYPELLLMQLPQSSELREPIKAIQESGKRAATVVADLLTVARGAATTRSPHDIHVLISEYLHSPECKNLHSLHPAIVCLENLEAKHSIISCSPVHIKKTIMNLVGNGMEAIVGKGTIIVSTTNHQLDTHQALRLNIQAGDYLILSVKDDGTGIAEKDLEHIFEPFYTKKVMGKSGTGLGLAIVWNSLQDHNGKVTVESNAQGTRFDLYFPIDEQDIIEEKEKDNPEEVIDTNKHILIVDDEPQLRDLATKMLESIGYKVDSVCSGESAIAFVKDNPIDLVVLDMLMEPGINGYETYKAILERYPDQKSVVVSGFSDSENVKATLRLGAGGFIKKPYSVAQLGRVVGEVLKS